MPPPPLLWVSPSQQEQRSLETPKKALESPLPKQVTMVSKEQKETSESPLKDQDMMVSMNQVLTPTMVADKNSEIPLKDAKRSDDQKFKDFVEVKGDACSEVQGHQTLIKSREPTQEVTQKRPGNKSSTDKEVEMSNLRQPQSTVALKQEKETLSPTLSTDSGHLSSTGPQGATSTGPLGAAPKKIVLATLTNQGPLTAQPSAPPPAVVSQQLSQVLQNAVV